MPRWEGRLAKSRIFLIDGNCDNRARSRIIQYESAQQKMEKTSCITFSNVSSSSSWSHPVIVHRNCWLGGRGGKKTGWHTDLGRV
jgi:hypothetical protein